MIEKEQLRKILEGALLAYGQPLSIDQLHALFVTETTDTEEGDSLPVHAQVEKKDILSMLEEIQQRCGDNHGYELKQVASGWRFQVREETAPWVNKLWDEKPQRYSRALMETIAIIAYRQPITRGDIEEIRGVAVSSNIIKTLSEREWIKVIGHRDVPGRPSLFATTRQFLDYFNLKNLEDLPSLQELADIETLNPELNLQAVPVSNTADETTEVDEHSTADLSEVVDENPNTESDEQVVH
jgi:segregation and condensation protein B